MTVPSGAVRVTWIRTAIPFAIFCGIGGLALSVVRGSTNLVGGAVAGHHLIAHFTYGRDLTGREEMLDLIVDLVTQTQRSVGVVLLGRDVAAGRTRQAVLVPLRQGRLERTRLGGDRERLVDLRAEHLEAGGARPQLGAQVI